MKRRGYLWPQIISFDSMLQASRSARRGKRLRPPVAAFEFGLERELVQLCAELADKTYRPGPYRSFWIREPKLRQISAAPYRDRIVHHALVRVLETVFEPAFVHDSYACRKGKGTHAAVRRAQHFMRRFPFVLKADIRKFFPSVDHEILKELIAKKIKDPSVIWLVNLIVDSSNRQEWVCDYYSSDDLFTPLERKKGIPIGNQTSQFFANVYLNPLDHFVKDCMGVGGYVRYADDFLVFGKSMEILRRHNEQVETFLERLRLRMHSSKRVISRCDNGIRYLGYRVFPNRILLPKENLRKFRRRIKWMQGRYAAGVMNWPGIRCRIMSWLGHAQQADAKALAENLLSDYWFSRGTTS